LWFLKAAEADSLAALLTEAEVLVSAGVMAVAVALAEFFKTTVLHKQTLF
jgi:hypothetical protein